MFHPILVENYERKPMSMALLPVWPHHRLDAVQGQLVRGDDQQPEQVCGEGHVLEHGRSEDLHRLRGESQPHEMLYFLFELL